MFLASEKETSTTGMRSVAPALLAKMSRPDIGAGLSEKKLKLKLGDLKMLLLHGFPDRL